MIKALLINTDLIKENSIIDDNISDDIIKFSLIDAQETILQPILGKLLYDRLITGVIDDDLTDVYKNMVRNYIWPVLIHSTIAQLTTNLTYRFTNAALNKSAIADYENITREEIFSTKSTRQSISDFHKRQLNDFLCANSDDFEEFSQTSDIEPNATLSNSSTTVYFPESFKRNSSYF